MTQEEKVIEDQKTYSTMWPNYCTSCRGEYIHSTYDMETGMWDVDFCDHLGTNQCHRCKKFGMTPNKQLPCKFCGWNYGKNVGDFMPQF